MSVRVVVFVEGGNVQQVVADAEVEVLVVDYDNERDSQQKHQAFDKPAVDLILVERAAAGTEHESLGEAL